MTADLQPEDVQTREVVGWLQGAPVYSIGTTGGYQIVAVLRHGRLEPLAMGTHDRTTLALARKREPSMRLVGLEKAESIDLSGEVVRRYEALTAHLRVMRGFSR